MSGWSVSWWWRWFLWGSVLGLMIWLAWRGTTRTVLRDDFQPSQKIRVALKWLHQTQFAGLYVASQDGLYAAHELEVELIPYDYVHSPVDEVASGRAQFGVIGADELLMARAAGKMVQAVAVVYQDTPVVAYALASTEIASVGDMRGKKVGMENSPDVKMGVEAMLRAAGLQKEIDYSEVEIGFDSRELLAGQVDVATGYVVNEPKQVELMGYEVKVFSPMDFGVRMYADVLITSEQMIHDNPTLVQNFVSATLDGWEVALQDQPLAVQATLRYLDAVDEIITTHQSQLLASSRELIRPKGSRFIGEMQYGRWLQTAMVLEEAGHIDDIKDFDIENSYTTQFIVDR